MIHKQKTPLPSPSNAVPLKSDLHHFDAAHFGNLSELLRSAAAGPQNILLLACADHGTAPDNVSFARPGTFYIVQNMGASVPGVSDPFSETTLANIQYAICHINVKAVIICGHLGCNVIRNDITKFAKCEKQNELFRLWSKAHETIDKHYPNTTPDQKANLLVREHLLFQLENLESHEFVQTRLNDGRLKLHCWLVDDETARVRNYDPVIGQFTSVTV